MAIAAAATWPLLPFAQQRSFGHRLSATGIVGSVTRCCSSCSAAAAVLSPTNSKSTAARLLTNAFLSGSRQLGSLLPQLPGYRKRRRRTVQASLLGVGAPEVLVIAVVALLVFGPKGLAEVARSLGRTLRAFKPAIQELQEVSKEFKQTLEKEIGLDEQQPPTGTSINSRPQQTPPRGYSSEDYLKVTEEQVRAFVSEADRKAAEEAAWRGTVPVKTSAPETAAEERIEPESAAPAAAAAASAAKPPSQEEQKTQEKTKDE